jgi:hypothetical protein
VPEEIPWGSSPAAHRFKARLGGLVLRSKDDFVLSAAKLTDVAHGPASSPCISLAKAVGASQARLQAVNRLSKRRWRDRRKRVRPWRQDHLGGQVAEPQVSSCLLAAIARRGRPDQAGFQLDDKVTFRVTTKFLAMSLHDACSISLAFPNSAGDTTCKSTVRPNCLSFTIFPFEPSFSVRASRTCYSTAFAELWSSAMLLHLSD